LAGLEEPDADDSDSDSGSEDSDDEEADEPGGLEDPGGDTDAEADAESDGDDNDSISDDPSDELEEEDEEDEDEEESDSGDSGDSGDELGADLDGDGLPDGDSGDLDGDGLPDGDSGDGDGDLGALELGNGAYPGDDASKEELAAWMAGQAKSRGIPPELPVMAALVESGLRNVDHGDADSVGFFQMRVGIWDQGPYEGYGDNPELQLKWFLDQAVAVKEQRVSAGKPIDDPGSYGDWVADIERPAEQYRGRYQLRLEEARGLISSGADSVGGGPEVGGAGVRATAAVAEARKYMGTPYKWGGSTPQTGFDCSGLVQWAYAKAGIRIPRTTYEQIDAPNGKPVERGDLLPGDLVFFKDSGGDVHHVGMSLGGDKFVHAPHTGDVVKVSSLKESYYAQEFAGGRRFDGARELRESWDKTAVRAVDPSSIDQSAVRSAEAALVRDAAQVQQPGTLLFKAVQAQEAGKGAMP
jgi:hypothetical protein